MTPLQTAIGLARKAHAKQRRWSGEPYVTHPLAVLRILQESSQALPVDIYLAAVLHDVLEESKIRVRK